ncbi:MAG: hypothetical protein ABW032_03380 [Burkholderiaceae bacterium]
MLRNVHETPPQTDAAPGSSLAGDDGADRSANVAVGQHKPLQPAFSGVAVKTKAPRKLPIFGSMVQDEHIAGLEQSYKNMQKTLSGKFELPDFGEIGYLAATPLAMSAATDFMHRFRADPELTQTVEILETQREHLDGQLQALQIDLEEATAGQLIRSYDGWQHSQELEDREKGNTRNYENYVDLKRIVATRKTEVEPLRATRDEQQEAIAAANKTAGRLELECEDLGPALAHTKKALGEAQAEHGKAAGLNSEKRSELAQLQQESNDRAFEQLMTSIDLYQETIRGLHEKIDPLDNVDHEGEEIDRREKSLKAEAKRLKADKRKHEEALGSLLAKHEQVSRQHAMVTGDVERLRGQLGQEQGRFSELKAQNEESKDEYRGLLTELAAQATRIAELKRSKLDIERTRPESGAGQPGAAGA